MNFCETLLRTIREIKEELRVRRGINDVEGVGKRRLG